MAQSKNISRLTQDMKRELIDVISTMKDPRLQGGLLSVMRLELAPDLSSAKVYVSMLGKDEGSKEAAQALNRACGHVRSEIAKRMHIRKTPEFRFIADDGAKYASHIQELLQQLYE